MSLSELVNYLISSNRLEEFYKDQGLNSESEALLIYMKVALNIDSEVSIFEIEETGDDLVFEKENVQYIQLFPLEYAVELIQEDLDLKDKGYSDLQIAKRLLEYREKDA